MVDFVKLKEDNEDNNKDKKIKISFRKILLIMLMFFMISSIFTSLSLSMSSKIAVVPIKGVITTDKSTSLYGSTTSSREIANILYELKDDNSVKSVILDINSPGGSPVASEEISKAIIELRKQKKVYGLINDIGASGAFWIGVSCDKLYASSMSTIGSIGVTSAGLSFENFIKQYNITYRKQTAGKYKDMGSPFRKPSNEENEIIQKILDEIHENFINHVANSRNLSYEQVKKYATGEVFLGTKALSIGFIDDIMNYEELVNKLTKNDSSILVIDYGPEKTFSEKLGLNSIFGFSTKSQILLK